MPKPSAQLIKILGATYLTGRKLNLAFLAFLVFRDLLLRPFLTVKAQPIPSWNTIQKTAVCVPDHLGDLLIVVPTLKALRALAPQAAIVLIVGEWCQALAMFLKAGGVADEVVICNLAFLDRSKRSLPEKFWRASKSRAKAISILKEHKIDLFFDMRAFSPNGWDIGFFSQAKFRLGFGLRGMAFTYHRLMDFSLELPTGQLLLDAIGDLGGQKIQYQGPALPSARLLCDKVVSEMASRPYVAIQFYSAEGKKNMPVDFWKAIIEKIQLDYDILLVGTEADGEQAKQEGLILPGVFPLFGKTTIEELLRLVEESQGVISIDSFSAHIGLAYEKPVAVLMADIFGDKRAYPQNNGLLAFFSYPANTSHEVALFFENFKGKRSPADSPLRQAV